MAPTFSPDRQAFREVLATLAAKTKTKIPELNGRVEKAVKLALAGDVELHNDGTATVYSSSDPTRRYEIREGTCTCRDYDQAPEHLCQHRLSAGLVRRISALLPPEPAPDQDDRGNLETPPAPLPEAPVSITLKASLHGYEALVTLRGTDFASVQAQVEQAAQWLRSQAPAQPSSGAGWCTIHNVALKETTKNGQTWRSHRTAEGWCRGK